MGKKKGIQAYLQKHPAETLQTVKLFLVQQCHSDWETGLCCGRTKTWSRLKLYKPNLAKYISKTEMYQLLRIDNQQTFLGCGVILRCKQLHLLSLEQQQRARRGQHVLSFLHSPTGPLTSSKRFMVLDRSRGPVESEQFWVAVVCSQVPPHPPLPQVVTARNVQVPWSRTRYCIPIHTKKLASVLEWPVILSFMRQQFDLGNIVHVICDQAWDLELEDWQRCKRFCSSMNHIFHTHSLGLQRQNVQCLAEQTIGTVRHWIRKLKAENNWIPPLNGDEANTWSMSIDNLHSIQCKLNPAL
jgi:hypothetical protein